MSNEYDCMLTTFDNPYDPFEQFSLWFMFDVEKGYNTCSYLARIVEVKEDFSQKEIDDETERAIDEIIANDFLNIYKKVRRNKEKPQELPEEGTNPD